METYRRWYILQVKAWCKQKENWLITAGLFLILACMTQIHLPDKTNVRVGIVAEDGVYDALQKELEQTDSVFSFSIYSDVEKLREDVTAARIECGFVIDKNFEEKVKKKEIHHLFTCYSSTLSNKQYMAQETLFAAFFRLYSDTLLKDAAENLFEQPDAVLYETLVQKNHEYQNSNATFAVNTTPVKISKREEAQVKTYPLQGVAAVLLFLFLFLEQGKKFDVSHSKVTTALSLSQGRIFRYLHTLAAGTIPCFASLLILLLSESGRGIVTETMAMLVFWIFGSLYVTILCRFFRNETTFLAWGIPFAVLQLLLCPVFTDFSVKIPAVGMFAKLFPVEWYLHY